MNEGTECYGKQIERIFSLDVYERMIGNQRLSCDDQQPAMLDSPCFSFLQRSMGVALSTDQLTVFSDPLGYRTACANTPVPFGAPYYFEYYPFEADLDPPQSNETSIGETCFAYTTALRHRVRQLHDELSFISRDLQVPINNLFSVGFPIQIERPHLEIPQCNLLDRPVTIEYRRKCRDMASHRGPGYAPQWRLGLRRFISTRNPGNMDVPLGWDSTGIGLRSRDGSVVHSGLRLKEGDFIQAFSPLGIVERDPDCSYGPGDTVGILVYFPDTSVHFDEPHELDQLYTVQEGQPQRNYRESKSRADEGSAIMWEPTHERSSLRSFLTQNHIQQTTFDQMTAAERAAAYRDDVRVGQRRLAHKGCVAFFVNGKRVLLLENVPLGTYCPAVSCYSATAAVTAYFGCRTSKPLFAVDPANEFRCLPAQDQLPEGVTREEIQTIAYTRHEQALRLLCQSRLKTLESKTFNGIAQMAAAFLQNETNRSAMVDELLDLRRTEIELINYQAAAVSSINVSQYIDVMGHYLQTGDPEVDRSIEERALESARQYLEKALHKYKIMKGPLAGSPRPPPALAPSATGDTVKRNIQ